MPVDRLSATAIADAMTCLERFRFERIKKIPASRGLAGFVGSTHHQTVEQLIRAKMAGEEITGGSIAEAYERAWEDSMSESEPEWEILPSEVAKNGLKMTESFVDTALPTIEAIGVEEWFEEQIPGVPVPIVGKIDAYEQERTLEFKTSKQKVSKAKAKWQMQARIYQLATDLPVEYIVTTRQVTPITYMPSTLPDLAVPLMNQDTTVAMIVQTVEILNDLYARYGPDSPWPVTGLAHDWACSYCPAGPTNPSPLCRAWQPC